METSHLQMENERRRTISVNSSDELPELLITSRLDKLPNVVFGEEPIVSSHSIVSFISTPYVKIDSLPAHLKSQVMKHLRTFNGVTYDSFDMTIAVRPGVPAQSGHIFTEESITDALNEYFKTAAPYKPVIVGGDVPDVSTVIGEVTNYSAKNGLFLGTFVPAMTPRGIDFLRSYVKSQDPDYIGPIAKLAFKARADNNPDSIDRTDPNAPIVKKFTIVGFGITLEEIA